jgi:mannose-6-phosphate isomerase-like protein (cupin superfamily)
MTRAYVVRKRDDVAPVPCPCGEARRIITGADNERVSVHRVSISGAAQVHYHEYLTECYVILSGRGDMVLNDQRVPVEPEDVILIPPGTRHALDGEFEIINIVSPPFDPSDEHLAESP